MVDDSLVEEIRARADLIDIAGEFVSLRRVGKSYRGPCPLHGGDGPNFSVDPERGIFKCFVCGEGGDVFGLLMKHLGLDFPTAVRRVAARVGIEVPEDRQREDPFGPLREVSAFAAEWFRGQLRGEAGAAARTYLESRAVTDDMVEAFGLGCAPDAWRALRAAAHAHGIEDARLLELGLLATSERADEPYDRFRDRLMFPIHDLRSRPIGFGGRALGPDDGVPKYINSPDSPIFHKGLELYGLSHARHPIRREGAAALVEGFLDVIAMHAADVPIAVAGLGTAFTADQAQRLADLTERVYLLYDSDGPGLKATFKAADLLLAAGAHPMVVTLPAGEDPDSIVRDRGPETLRGFMDDAVDVLERKLQILERGGYLDRADGRRRAVDGLLPTLRAVSDPALRDIYIDRAVERTGVRRDTLVHQMAQIDRHRTGPARARGWGRDDTGDPLHGASPRPGARGETDLLILTVRDPSLAAEAADRGVTAAHFSDPLDGELFESVAASAVPLEDDLLAGWPPRLAGRARSLLDDETEFTDTADAFQRAVMRLLSSPERARLLEIDRELGLADPGQQRKLLQEKQEIARRLREMGESRGFMPRSSDRS